MSEMPPIIRWGYGMGVLILLALTAVIAVRMVQNPVESALAVGMLAALVVVPYGLGWVIEVMTR